jgi:acetylornithine deacetylase/succinyl-diaminopimelate desuccinylase-like protein
MIEDAITYVDRTVGKSIQDLKRLCRIPSVAAKGEGMTEASELVEKMLNEAGFETRIHETSGSPVVTGELNTGAKRALLFYDHYDVQPAEPLDLWESPPYSPVIRDGHIFGRGVADNKGDLMTRIWAMKALKATGHELPVNVRFVVEGEEEISSPHLPEFVQSNTSFLKADGGIWEFGGSGPGGTQEVWLGLKGILYVQLEVQALSHDAHSGNACVLPSAAYRLVHALASLKNTENRILIPRFYDGSRPLSTKEAEAVSKVDMYERVYFDHYDVNHFLNNLSGMQLKEAYYNQPTCNICGFDSGWQGEGSKTILPAKASAKVDFRLVEGMDPEDILRKLRAHLDMNGFSDVKIAWHEGYPAAKTPVDHPFVGLVKRANRRAFGHDPVVHVTSPGSGPLYLFKNQVPMVSIGCGDFFSRVHSPNESIIIDNYVNSMKRTVYLVDEMARW